MPTSTPTFEVVSAMLSGQFHVEPELIAPETALQALGLDSLSLMEFVFAIEDHYTLRIPESQLDPRQADLTLANLCAALDEALAQRSASAQGA